MRWLGFIATVCVVFLAGQASEQAWAQVGNSHHIKARLVADSTTVPAGGTINLALDYVAEEGWHTYFVNPGEAGLAADFKWNPSNQVSVGDIQWPTPEKLNLLGLISYGYAGRTILVMPLTGAGDLIEGQGVNLSAKVNFLVCKDICVPETKDVALSLKVGPKSANPEPEIFATAAKKLPQEALFDGTIDINSGVAELGFLTGKKITSFNKTYFFPYAEDVLSPSADQITDRGQEGFSIKVAAKAPSVPPAGVGGILSINGKGYQIHLKPTPLGPGLKGLGIKADTDVVTILAAIIFAFLGGIILNLMPCVFPVLSMKLISIAQAGQDKPLARAESRLYALGAILSFIALAGVIEGARLFGGALGWGFQLQNPYVTAGLAITMLLVGLNMAGFFLMGSSLQSLGAPLGFAQHRPRLAAFLTGVLAVVVAAPCTAPFMATAIGVALSQGGWINGAIFLSLGIGFAAPVLILTYLITFSPNLAAKMPRPGAWMDRLKITLSVPMFLACLWLWWVFSQQIGTFGPLLLAVALMILIVAFLPIPAKAWIRLIALGGAFALAIFAASMAPISKPERGSLVAASVAFDAKALDAYRSQGRAVLVDMTAAWCVTCKVNERLVLNSDALTQTLKATDTIYMVGDWTNADPAITAYLEQFGRSGVPLYVYYPKHGGAPVVLPQMLDKQKLIEILQGQNASR